MENVNMEYFKQFVDASGLVIACVVFTAIVVFFIAIVIAVLLADKKMYCSKYNDLVDDYNHLKERCNQFCNDLAIKSCEVVDLRCALREKSEVVKRGRPRKK